MKVKKETMKVKKEIEKIRNETDKAKNVTEKVKKEKDTVKRRPRTRSMSEDPSAQEAKPVEEKQKEKKVEEGDFSNFQMSKKIVKKLTDNGIKNLFPTQVLTYDIAASGNDLIVQARTGSGKTLAFALPLLNSMYKMPKETFEKKQRPPMVLTLAPTRELAIQIEKEYEKYKPKKASVACFYGGTEYYKQENKMWEGIDILVGTPGRIMDHLEKGNLDISTVKHVVLDEADRMMDMGFQESIDKILSYAYTDSNKPQTLLFSATVPEWLKQTSEKYMSKNMKQVNLIKTTNKSSVTVEHKAIKCPYHERATVIRDIIQVYGGKFGKTIIFTSTKKEANELSMSSVINMESQVLHGDIQQQQREITLKGFRDGNFNCLIATDVAARGLDIPEVDLVIQSEPPKDVDSYIHRSGRTGRAGRAGVCIIFYKPGQEHGLQSVEHKAGIKFTRIGAPQQADILKASADDAVKSLDSVKDNVLQVFMPQAEKLIKERGAENALAAALAFISGTTELSSRSLLSSHAGFKTYVMTQNWELRSTGLIWNILKRHFDQELTDSIKGMRMTKDKLGCVFDIPEEYLKQVEEAWQGDKFATLTECTELPELQEGVSSHLNQNGYSNGGGRGGFGSRGGRGFNRGGGGGRGFGRGGQNNSWNNRNGNSNGNSWNNDRNSNGKRTYNGSGGGGAAKKFKIN